MTNHTNRSTSNRYYLVRDDNSCTIYDRKAVFSEELKGYVMPAVQTFPYWGPEGSGRLSGDAIREAKEKIDELNSLEQKKKD